MTEQNGEVFSEMSKESEESIRFLDGYTNQYDGYTENPFAHYENVSASAIEEEYYMQWAFPQKLHRVALRTAPGYRLCYKQAEDVWNNNLGIKIDDDKKKAERINKQLVPYLRSRNWFREMEKLTGYYIEQGEAILMLYYDDQGNIHNYRNPVNPKKEVLGVEAFNVIDYWIQEWDKYGEPRIYNITVKTTDHYNSYVRVPVHASRVLRFSGPNVEFRWRGYSDLAAVYDAINILSSILKATGEAAFRWSTGHPVIFTKDLFSETELTKLKDAIGDFTRRSWHMMPSEYIDRIDLMGQAGSMLNLKALADVAIDQIVIGSSYPRSVFLGEVAGVMGSEVEERSYFGLLDRRHTELEWFVQEYFRRDINIQKLFDGKQYEIDWGIREVLNKMDQADLRQKEISNALALLQICSINECREVAGFEPLSEDEGGEIILPIIELELQMIQLEMMQEQAEMQMKASENVETTSAKQKAASTEKKAQTGHSLDKKGKGSMKDAFETILGGKSINKRSKDLNLHANTLRKIRDAIAEDYILKNKKNEE